MAYNPPSIDEIISRLKTYIKSVLNELNPTDQNNFIYSLLVAMANLSNDNNLQLKLDIIPNSFVTTVKNEDALEPFAILKSVPKNLATISTGKAVISGIAGSIIPLGSNFVANQITYRTTATAEVNTQSININSITCNGKTVTVTTASNHNFASNIPITISGCNTNIFNGTFPITVTDLNQFTYQISDTTTETEVNTGTASGTIAVLQLRSETAGKNTELQNGDSLAIESQIAGVGGNAYAMFSGISGGTDDESFESWKARVIYRYQNPITYFNEANIIDEAKKIEGVTRVWVLKCTPVLGQVTIYFVRDNDANIFPDANEVAKVKEAVVKLRTVKDSDLDIFVYSPVAKTVNFTIEDIQPNTPTMKIAIQNSLQQFFTNEVNLGKTLTIDKIKSAIQNSFDIETGQQLDTYTLTSPSADIICGQGELANLGSITFI